MYVNIFTLYVQMHLKRIRSRNSRNRISAIRRRTFLSEVLIPPTFCPRTEGRFIGLETKCLKVICWKKRSADAFGFKTVYELQLTTRWIQLNWNQIKIKKIFWEKLNFVHLLLKLLLKKYKLRTQCIIIKKKFWK